MKSSVNLIRGRVFVRGAILSAQGVTGPEQALAAATYRWGPAQAEQIAKAALPAFSTDDTGDVAAREFLSVVREKSLIGRLVGLRRVPFDVRGLRFVDGAKGYWVAEGKPVPMSKPTMDGTVLRPLRVAALIATTKEMIAAQGDAAENALQADLESALAGAMDAVFLDPSNAGTPDEIPASITHGATLIPASGNLQADIAAVIAAFQGDLSAAYWVTDPTTATRIGMATDAGGRYLFPEMGPRGGALLGIPALTTRQSPQSSSGGQLALIDPTGIAANVEQLTLSVSTEATVQMTDTPSDGATVGVSLWQTNSVGFMASMQGNWDVQRPGSVVVLEGL